MEKSHGNALCGKLEGDEMLASQKNTVLTEFISLFPLILAAALQPQVRSSVGAVLWSEQFRPEIIHVGRTKHHDETIRARARQGDL